MTPTQITMRVYRSAALREGRTLAGDAVLILRDEDLALLTTEEREQLALHVAREGEWEARLDSESGHADLETLRAALATRARTIAAEKRAAEERRAEQARLAEEQRSANALAVRALLPEIEALVAAAEATGEAATIEAGPVYLTLDYRHVEAPLIDDTTYALLLALATRLEAVRDAAETAATAEKAAKARATLDKQAAAQAAWLRDHATDEQRARAEAGLLPYSEIVGGLEDIVWAPFAGEPLYERLDREDVAHETSDYDECSGKMRFRSDDATEASPEAFARVQAIRALAPAGAVVTLRTHVATYDGEECGMANRYGVRVEITTGGRTFRREFAA